MLAQNPRQESQHRERADRQDRHPQLPFEPNRVMLMKTTQLQPRREQGSVLLVSLVVAAIMAITLASYLAMTQAQNVSVIRSQTWNTALVLTEAGVEDGLAE